MSSNWSPITSRASGPTIRIHPMSGASCPRVRTSASTPRRLSPSGRDWKPSGFRSQRERLDGRGANRRETYRSRDRGAHRGGIPRGPAQRRARDLAERREDQPPARARRAALGCGVDGERFRPPARARGRNARSLARRRSPRQRDTPDPALAGRPRAPQARDRADRISFGWDDGPNARLPNVTFACFAGRADVWARRGNEQGAENLVAYQKLMRDGDLSTTHALMNPQVDRSKP